MRRLGKPVHCHPLPAPRPFPIEAVVEKPALRQGLMWLAWDWRV